MADALVSQDNVQRLKLFQVLLEPSSFQTLLNQYVFYILLRLLIFAQLKIGLVVYEVLQIF